MFEGVMNTEVYRNNNNNNNNDNNDRQNMEGCNTEFPSNKIYMHV